ncbi:MAG: cytidine deaminase [Coleofasciculaceae cyanobacterium]
MTPEEITQALFSFSPDAQEKLLSLINSKKDKFKGVILAENVQIITTFLQQSVEELMVSLLPLAGLYAHPPISKFKVGAVSRGASGNLYFGVNLEFIGQALSMSVHAEQAAVNNAWLNGEIGLSSIAINYLPCGYCRQFLNELVTAPDLKILLPNNSIRRLTDLLPEPFSPKDLGIEGGLMQYEQHHLQLQESSNDSVRLTALAAANTSYAPYSKGYSGVALLTTNGIVYTGRYAENVAFNPSMSPLQSALSQLNLGGNIYQDIQRVVLVEKLASQCSQIDVSINVLKSVCSLELEVVRAS